MALTLLRPQESSIPYVVFGKLPNRPDFVRINATHPVATEFDEFIQNVMEHFRTQEGWEERYDFASVIDFCYPTRDQKWLFTGALMSSCDQSKRRFPLVAGVAFPAQVIGGERRLMPIACEVFFEGLREQLSTAIDNSVEAMACRQYLESQTATWSIGANDIPLAGEIVKHFMDTQHPAILETLLAEKYPPGTLMQALLNIAFYRDFLRRFNNPAAIQVIELPLQGGRGEAALHACAWLSLLAAISGSTEPWHGGFLLKQGRDSARLYATFGRMPEKTLMVAMGGETRDDTRLNLHAEQKTWQSHRLYAETAYAMDRVLADPGLTLTNLQFFLKETGQKIANAGS
jgi:type VI secretion system protein ImpM